MSAGMAGIIAAHLEHEVKLDHDSYLAVCTGCNWRRRHGGESRRESHAAHVAEELTKAGYGLVPDVAPEYGARTMLVNGLSAEPHPHGPAPHPSSFSKSTHVRLVGPWKELTPLPDPLAAAMNDEEGRALVQAIHDRKAGV